MSEWLCLCSQNKSQMPTCHTWRSSFPSTQSYLSDRILGAGSVPSRVLLSAPPTVPRARSPAPLGGTPALGPVERARTAGTQPTGNLPEISFPDLAGIRSLEDTTSCQEGIGSVWCEYGKAEVRLPKMSICKECSKIIEFIKAKIRKCCFIYCALTSISRPFCGVRM